MFVIMYIYYTDEIRDFFSFCHLDCILGFLLFTFYDFHVSSFMTQNVYYCWFFIAIDFYLWHFFVVKFSLFIYVLISHNFTKNHSEMFLPSVRNPCGLNIDIPSFQRIPAVKMKPGIKQGCILPRNSTTLWLCS